MRARRSGSFSKGREQSRYGAPSPIRVPGPPGGCRREEKPVEPRGSPAPAELTRANGSLQPAWLGRRRRRHAPRGREKNL